MADNLDQDVVNLAKAIREHETGNKPIAGQSGELPSRYQFMPGTWKSESQRILGDANAPLTLENENKVAYTRIKEKKDAGWSPDKIASWWNSGSPDYAGKIGVNKAGVKYDVPAYVADVGNRYKRLKEQKSIAPPISPEQPSSALFPAKQGEGMFMAGAKTLLNLPGSALGFAKGAIEQLNPVQTAKNIQQFGTGITEFAKEKGGLLPALGAVAKELPGAAYKTLVPQAAQQLIKGDTIAAQKTLTEDPFGQVAPFVFAAEGGAKALGKESVIGEGINKVAKPVVEPLKAAGRGLGKAAEFATAQATGLNPETINTIIKNPKAFESADIAGDSRLTTAAKVKAALDASIQDLGETGKAYQNIRERSVGRVLFPTGILDDVLKKYGITLKDGKIQTTAESVPLSPGDISSIEQFINQYGPDKVKSYNSFLNARKALDNLSSWDATKTDASTKIARDIRAKYDDIGKRQIIGLRKLDAQYGPMVKELKQLKKDYLNADGTLKDGAINKIANLLGKGKEPILQRLEQVSPGITADIKIVKALEDVAAAGGQKVGTYNRLAGAALGGLTGGWIGAAIGAILTTPRIAVYFLEKYGEASGVGKLMVNKIKTKFVNGTKLNTVEGRAFLTILGTAAQQESQSSAQVQ